MTSLTERASTPPSQLGQPPSTVQTWATPGLSSCPKVLEGCRAIDGAPGPKAALPGLRPGRGTPVAATILENPGGLAAEVDTIEKVADRRISAALAARESTIDTQLAETQQRIMAELKVDMAEETDRLRIRIEELEQNHRDPEPQTTQPLQPQHEGQHAVEQQDRQQPQHEPEIAAGSLGSCTCEADLKIVRAVYTALKLRNDRQKSCL